MDINGVSYRNIEKNDNKQLANLIRSVFREFGIDRPGTVYFDPTTDERYELFRKERSVYRIAGVGGVMAGGCGIDSHKPRSWKLGPFRLQYMDN